ncbi:MAG: hypothetical protein Q9171_003708 [Xanthocarpia ochracea]
MEKLRILVIAGSDSSGGAGLEADQKVIAAHQCYAMTATTALTAQNTQGVHDIHYVPSAFVSRQIDACIDDIGVDVVKIGMLASAETVDAVAQALEKHGRPTCVLDPVFHSILPLLPLFAHLTHGQVMVATTGAQLLPTPAVTNVRRQLLPLTTILTPNISEAILLLQNAGMDLAPEITSAKDLVRLATLLQPMGPTYVLIKGGHVPLDDDLNVPHQPTDRKYVVNVLYTGSEATLFITKFSLSKNTHGTGCSLASAIASNLARGHDIRGAVEDACRYVEAGIITSPDLGRGCGPINHFHSVVVASERSRESSLRVQAWDLDG